MTINSLVKMTDDDTHIVVSVCTQVFPWKWEKLERNDCGCWEDEGLFNKYKSAQVTRINPRHTLTLVDGSMNYNDYLQATAFTKDAFTKRED